MRRPIFFILLTTFAILALMFFLWFWLLRAPLPTDTTTGQLGEGGTRTPTTGTSPTAGNGQTPIGGTTNPGTNVQTPITPPGAGGATRPPTQQRPTTGSSYSYVPYTPGGTWLNGTYVTTSTPSGTGSPQQFTPTPINQLIDVDINGTGYFPNTPNGSAGTGIGNGLLGFGIAAVGCTVGLLNSGAAAGAGGASLATDAVTATVPAVPVADITLRVQGSVQIAQQGSQNYKETFLDCIARTIARAAIDRITADIVDWINSGFEGKPAFVQNFRQYLNDVGNQAGGEFISGSKLAFLCSPFQLQVKIAVAKSFAQRNSSSGEDNACTLNDVTNNIRGFMEGTFSDGGWPAFIEFTTAEANNPFSAFMTVQAQIGNEIASAQAEAQLEIQLGNGFLSQRDENGNIVTPGTTINAALERTVGQSLESLQLADNFDEIISALVSQLMTRTLYGGLANLSGQNGYANNFISAEDEQAKEAAEALLASLQGVVQQAQQYGVAKQGSISDIQNAQNLLQSLSNCWSVTASSSALSTAQQSQALMNMQSAVAAKANLENRITALNLDITRANAAITKIEQFQTNALAATTKAQINTISAEFAAARNSGSLISATDVTNAQQDRTTLQAEMSSLNQTTNAQVTQCYAFGQ